MVKLLDLLGRKIFQNPGTGFFGELNSAGRGLSGNPLLLMLTYA